MIDLIIGEAECWCALNNKNVDNLNEEDLQQCIINVAATLDLIEEDVEFILKRNI